MGSIEKPVRIVGEALGRPLNMAIKEVEAADVNILAVPFTAVCMACMVMTQGSAASSGRLFFIYP